MTERKVKYCEQCFDGDDGCVFPYYGLEPHVHTKIIGGTEFLSEPYPENFSPDGDGLGVWTHCLSCGGDGTYDGVSIEAQEQGQ